MSDTPKLYTSRHTVVTVHTQSTGEQNHGQRSARTSVMNHLVDLFVAHDTVRKHDGTVEVGAEVDLPLYLIAKTFTPGSEDLLQHGV
jgi:hypothetical protein